MGVWPISILLLIGGKPGTDVSRINDSVYRWSVTSDRMVKDQGLVLPLEQKLIRPGHWKIEGYDAVREDKVWHLSFAGQAIETFSTLREVRHWIADQRG